MASQQELTQQLNAVLAQQQKTATEIAGLHAASEALKEQIDALQAVLDSGEATPELTAAVQAVAAQAQVVDDAIPDSPQP